MSDDFPRWLAQRCGTPAAAHRFFDFHEEFTPPEPGRNRHSQDGCERWARGRPCRHNERVRSSALLLRVSVLPLLVSLTGVPGLAQPVQAQSMPAQSMVPTLVIEAPADMASVRTRLEAYDLSHLADISRLVGVARAGRPMRVVLAADDSEWARQVPPWVAGYAIGNASLVVLFPSRSPSYPHDTLEDVLRHEVAHVLIDRAAEGQPVPRWFHEGLAMAVERPWRLGDRTRLASELLFGPRLTLEAIDDLFLANQGAAARAYSVSAGVMRDLMQAYGADAPAAVLRVVAGGASFDAALAQVTARSVRSFEAEFWDRQRAWRMWIPLAASSTVLWLGVIGLAALAKRRRRLRAEVIRRRWAREEEQEQEEELEDDDEDTNLRVM